MKWIIDLYRKLTSFEGSLFKYSLSFFLLLALTPSLLLITILFHFAYLPMDVIMKFLISFMPDMSMDGLDQVSQFFANQNYSITSFIVTVCVSFYLAGKNIFSFPLISASYESVEIPKWSTHIKFVVLLVSLVLLLILSIFIVTRLNEFLSIMSAAITLLLSTMMYRASSFRKRNWSLGTIGTVFSTTYILGLAALSITIISRFTSYKDIYGPLVSPITLLLAIYLIFCIIYLGFRLNLICEEGHGREEALSLKSGKFFILCSELTKRIHGRFQRRKRKSYMKVAIRRTRINGGGVGYIDRMSVFVSQALIGEEAGIRIVDKQKRYATAELLRVVRSSKGCIHPKCFIQNICGVCLLVIARYPAQLEYKQNLLKQSLIEYAQIGPRRVARARAGEDVLDYWDQFKLPCAMGEERLINNSFMPNFNYFIDVKKCWVHEDDLEWVHMDVVRVLSTYGCVSYNPHDKKSICNLAIRDFNNRYQRTVIMSNGEFDERLIFDLMRIKGLTNLQQSIHTIRKIPEAFSDKMMYLVGGTSPAMELDGLKLRIPPRSLFQLNSKQTVQLYRTIASMVKENNELTVEAHSGIGVTSLYLKDKAKEIIGIESIRDTVVNANQNAALNSREYVSFLYDGAANRPTYLPKKRSIDILTVDPSGGGLNDTTLEYVLRSKIKDIIYVPCNPAAFGKGLAVLCSRYDVGRIQPIDIFPYIPYVENVILMLRKNK